MNLSSIRARTVPLDNQEQWTQQLCQIGAAPLAQCAEFPLIARRFEAWWNHDVLDRPILIGAANSNPARPITRRLELLREPGRWMEAKQEDLRQLHRVGDALPNIRVDFGPVMLGALLGATIEFNSDTTWTHACINDDWSNAPTWELREDNPWWRLLRTLMDAVAADAAGRYLVCTPDLGGSADVLLNLRGSGPLCLDCLKHPDRIKSAIASIYPVWQKAFTELYRGSLHRGAGLIHWLQIWSDRPYTVAACDFNALIGPKHFQEICLPDIACQAAAVGRAVFHLDGPDAARHIDALLEVPELQAIQFTPGAGSPSTMRWIEMFRKIQSRGRSLLVFCPADEVLTLCRQLRPEGLAIFLDAPPSPVGLNELFEQFSALYP